MRELVQAIVDWIIDHWAWVLSSVVVFVALLWLGLNQARAHDETGNLSGIYFDSNRTGEGLYVVHDTVFNVMAWAFFTHDPEYPIEACTITNPVTAPSGEVLQGAEEVCVSVIIDRTAAWYIAADPWAGSSSGIVYECEAYDYPITVALKLCEERSVGMYILDWVEGAGFRLIITPTGGAAPSTVYNWYWFNTALLKAR